MGKKIIAIGNRIMMDDAIGVLICEALQKDLENLGFDVVIGETDVDYCISSIKNEDFIIILDATFYGIETGKITILDITKKNNIYEKGYSQHQLSLIKLLHSYSFKDISGYILGIEAEEIDYGVELSHGIAKNFEGIKSRVYGLIQDIDYSMYK